MKIRVGILENDRLYLERLVHYFTTYYIDKVDIAVFQEEYNFLDYIKKTKLDVVLANPNMVSEELVIPKTMILAYFSGSPEAERIGDVKVVFKYQKADMIYREILGLYAELDSRTSYREASGESPIYYFLGASGGVGTTTVALACALSLARYGKKVLYLNLEENGVISPFLQGEGKATLSDVLYAVESGNSNLVLKLESMVRVSEDGIYFYEPFALTMDAHELNERNLLSILKTISTYESYDCILVDGDSNIVWKRNLLMQLSQRYFVLADSSEIGSRKLERLMKEIAILDENQENRFLAKAGVIYNRSTGMAGQKIPSDFRENMFCEIESYMRSTPRKVMEEIAGHPYFDPLV